MSADIHFQQSRFCNINIHIRTIIETLVLIVRVIRLSQLLQHTVLQQISQRDKITETLTATRQRQVMLCLPSKVLEKIIVPVNIGKHNRIFIRSEHIYHKWREAQLRFRQRGIVT